MPKQTFYFSHDYYARADEKMVNLISKDGWLGYGIYWAIIEKLHEANGWLETNFEALSFDLREDKNLIQRVVESYKLFKFRGEKFSSDRVLNNLKARKQKIETGRKSAQLRWNKQVKENGYPLGTQCEPNAIKERKGKERKGNKTREIFSEFLTDSSFKNAFNDFLEMRQKIRKPATKRAQEMILRELEKYDIETAKAMLNESIKNSWQGVFPLKNQQKVVYENPL